MAQELTASCQIEIRAPPATVRSIFLDFAGYNKWQTGWQVTPVDQAKPSSELAPGDSIKVNMHGMRFTPTVAENTPELFIWDGSLYGLIGGKHHFYFSPSKENPGGTTFIQSENFYGSLMFLFKPFTKNFDSKPPSENWVNFNEALKKEAELVAGQASKPN